MKRAWKMAIGGLAFYVAVYSGLSVTGGYEPCKSGKFTRYNLPTHDVYLWQLRFGRDSPFHGYSEFVPMIFAPLLWMDRKLWHPQLPMLRLMESGEIVDCPPPESGLLHPRMQEAHQFMADFTARRKEAKRTGSTDEDKALTEAMLKAIEGIYD